jgi:diguanylate cyclase (GGDEF)-like protein
MGVINQRTRPPERSAEPGGRRRVWKLVAGAVLVAGLAASLAGALWSASNTRAQNAQARQSLAAGITATMGTLLRNQADFASTLRTVLTREPHLTPSQFRVWYAELAGADRQVGSLGTTVLAAVPESELGAFQRRRDADPAFRRLVGGEVLPIAPTRRPVRCLLAAGVAAIAIGESYARLIQTDWCAPRTVLGDTEGVLLAQAADTGQLVVKSVNTVGVRTAFLETAFYRSGAPLRTPAERRSAIRGWIFSSVDIEALLRAATLGRPGIAMTLYHSDPGEPAALVGRLGSLDHGGPAPLSAKLDVEGTWTVMVQAGSSAGGPSPTAQALMAGGAGTIVSVLLFILLLVLTRSREHALGMVREKTGELRHQASHDPLTGLPNRVLAIEHTEAMLARADRAGAGAAVLYIDIDGFKHVNDTFGHAAGDRLLRLVAGRLGQVVRGGDIAARLGGDEFVILLEGPSLAAGAEHTAGRVLALMREPYDMTGEIGRLLWVTVSIGVASGTRASADALLCDADLALYEAKVEGKNRIAVFGPEMQRIARERLTFQIDLADALERGELFLQYQPIYELASEEIIGVEALLRWRHPTRGIVPPGEFIPIAEESGLILPIGRWVLEQATAQAAAWRAAGHELSVWVNVSSRQLDHPELVDEVGSALDRTGLDAGALVIEVTETALMRDSAAASGGLAALKQLGVRVAIDDFGTGYSSLGHLRRFPADILKIDRSFMSGVTDKPGSAALIHTLIQLGEALGIATVAEGIEEPVQLQALRSEHCRYGQGYLFSRPVDAAAVEGLLGALLTARR